MCMMVSVRKNDGDDHVDDDDNDDDSCDGNHDYDGDD